MKLQLDNSCPLNLDATLCCGQIFRWHRQDKWWYGIFKNTPFKMRQIADRVEFENVDTSFLAYYLGLGDNLPKIYRQIGKEANIRKAIKQCAGLRIVHQDPWECLISYICATYKNIPAIERMLNNLCKSLGEPIPFEGKKFYTFPTLEALARTRTSDLKKCGLGYRAKYISETAKKILETGINFDQMKQEDYGALKKELLLLPGVGPKVADCVMLFSLEKTEAFPIDVWVRRVLLKYYSDHFPVKFVRNIISKNSLTTAEYNRLNSFGRSYFGEYAGYAQQYLYHYERTKTMKNA